MGNLTLLESTIQQKEIFLLGPPLIDSSHGYMYVCTTLRIPIIYDKIICFCWTSLTSKDRSKGWWISK